MRNEQFSLTLQHVKNGMAGRCPKTGVFFDLSPRGTSSNPYAPSVDKRNRLLPYSDENVQIVCWAYNRMKSDMSDEDLLFFCKLIAGVQP